MRSFLVAVVLFTSAVAAGCLAPADLGGASTAAPSLEPLTEAVFGFGVFDTMRVTARDGVELHVDVQLPDGEGPFPVVVA